MSLNKIYLSKKLSWYTKVKWGWLFLFLKLPVPEKNSILFLKNLFIILFIYFWLCWVFVAAHGLSLMRRAGFTLQCSVRASHCSGFSCCGVWALRARASVVVAHGLSSCGLRALEHRLSSCGARA